MILNLADNKKAMLGFESDHPYIIIFNDQWDILDEILGASSILTHIKETNHNYPKDFIRRVKSDKENLLV